MACARRTQCFRLSGRAGLALVAVMGVATAAAQVAPLNPDQGLPLRYVIPEPPQISTLYHDGSQIVVEGSQVWRFMCSSDVAQMTLADLQAIAHQHRDTFQSAVIVDRGVRGTNINIVYDLDASVPPEAVPAFTTAEAYVEGLFGDPINVRVTVSYANLGSGVIGATGSFFVNSVGYSTSRTGLQAGMDSDDVIQSWLPSGNTIPVRYDGSSTTVTNENTLNWTRANYRATIGSITGTAADMTLNSNFLFDYDPSNGVGFNRTSAVDVIIHETGHALGFTSAADAGNNTMEALDIYRFQRTDGTGNYNPDTYQQFQTTPRLVDFNNPNDDHNSDLIDFTYRMSDGSPYQASHFRESSPSIGQMDPAIAAGETRYPNFFAASDINMFDAVGYDHPPAPPCTPPNITQQPPASQTVCNGDDVSMSVATDATSPTYQWRRGTSNLTNDGRITGVTTATLVINNVLESDEATNYNCVITADGCDATSNNSALVVNPLPTITQQPPVSQTVCVGDDVSMSVATSAAGATFQWRRGGANLTNDGHFAGVTTATLVINNVTEADEAGDYDCVITAAGCSSTSNDSAVLVNPLPTITQQPPVSQTVCAGSQVSLSVATDAAGPTYQWRRGTTNLVNDGRITGVTTAMLTINNIGEADEASDYNCVVSANGCDATSNDAAITVNPIPTITQQPQASQSACEGEIVALAVATNAPSPSFQWRRGVTNLVNDGRITGVNTALLTINGVLESDEASDYNCVVTSAGCSATSNNAQIIVGPVVVITGQPPAAVTVNAGDPFVLSVTVQGDVGDFTFQWRQDGNPLSDDAHRSGSTTPTLTVNPAATADAGVYDCVITSIQGGCSATSSGSTVTVTTPGCPGDFDHDGSRGLGDLAILLANFGASGVGPDEGDMTGDGNVSLEDLAAFLAVFGTNCP